MASYFYLFKYIIIGDSGVGKSCFLLQFLEKYFKDNHDLTIGIEFGTRNLTVDNKVLKLQIFDTVNFTQAGQENYHSITRSYFRGVTGALILYDVTKRDTFLNIATWIDQIHTDASQTLDIILVGNKDDLNSNKEVPTEEAQEFANLRNMLFIEASAKTGYNVESSFLQLSERILSRIASNEINTSDERYGIKVGNALFRKSFKLDEKPESPISHPRLNSSAKVSKSCRC